jgi:2-iminobutanoate/2-iminopropanoate deaminase
MRIERLKPDQIWDSTPYQFTQGIRVTQCQSLLFIAGQVGMSQQGEILPGTDDQIRQCFENIRLMVTAAGGSIANIVKITGYLRDMTALPTYTKVVGEVFGSELPAATVVEVKSLAIEGLLVEVEAIAVL